MSRNTLIARNTAFLVAGQFVTWTFSLLFLVLVPRAVGPSEWGELGVASAVTSVAGALVGLGMGKLLIKDVARDRDRAAQYIGTALTVRILALIPYMLIIMGVAYFGRYTPHTRLIIAIAATSALVTFLAGPFNAGLLAFEKMHITSAADTITEVLVGGASVILVLFTRVDVMAVALVGLGTNLLGCTFQVYWLYRTVRVRPRFDWPLIRYMVVASLPFGMTFLFLSFYTSIDSLMLSFMAPTAVVGWYAAASRLFTSLLFVPTILTTALFPALSYHFKHDKAEMGRLVNRSFALLTSVSLPITAGTIIVAPTMVHLLYGQSYAPSSVILMVLALTLVPMYLNILVNQVLVAADRQVVWTGVMAAMCVINPLVNLATITYFQRVYGNGAVGAAWAMLVTEGLMGVIAIYLLPRGLLSRTTLLPILRSGVATGLMVLASWPLRHQFILIPVGLGVAVYFLAALALRVFPSEDLALIFGVAGKILRKLGLRYRLRSSAADRAAGMPLTMLDLMIEDLRVWKRHELAGDTPAGDVGVRAVDVAWILWGQPGARATLIYRLSAEARRLRIPLLPGMLARRIMRRYGLDIAPDVRAGPGLYVAHPVGTVVYAGMIGRNCHLVHAGTIGTRGTRERPIIGDDVFVGAGVRLLGSVYVGDGARLEANAVVIGDVPAGATVAGAPSHLYARHATSLDGDRSERDPVLAGTDASRHVNGKGNNHALDI